MHEIIEGYCENNNLIFGVTDAEELDGRFIPLENLSKNYITNIPFFKGSVQSRLNPSLSLENAKSVIVLGAKHDTMPMDSLLSGIAAGSLCSVDYHKSLRSICEGLIIKMLEKSKFNYHIQIDAGPLYEKGFALKAGLGFAGGNQLVISQRFGTSFNIALIITDLDIKRVNSERDSNKNCDFCRSCMLCAEKCPSKALSAENFFSYENCISYITQKKGVLSQREMLLLNTSIYGCDICQNICPFNNGKGKEILARDFRYKQESLRQIINMSKREYENRFRNSNFFWRGRTIIMRNSLILLYNIDGGNNADIFQRYAQGENGVLKQTAEILLERINYQSR